MIDAIAIEVIRCKLESIADDGARTIVRTAVSPAVSEAGDCSCSIYTAGGELIVGGGHVVMHFHTGCNGVAKILEVHGDTIANGDIFLVNDPYSGGGFHAQDVFIHIPVFVENKLVAWVGSSAHMMDMGGSVLGSFSPAATECYQEAIRFPPVRLSRKGEEQLDIWAILRNNIRLTDLVEIDMRSLISGAYVTQQNLVNLIKDYGYETFTAVASELINLTEKEVVKRIGELEPGEYKFVSWSEWFDEYYKIPCTLTVGEDKLHFDFTDASPQSSHYFNSKSYVIQSLLGVQMASTLAYDLPLNEGVFRAFEVKCRQGSILDAQPPAPIGAPHLEVGMNAAGVAMHALNLAIAASPDSRARKNMAGPSGGSGIGVATFSGTGIKGDPDGWLMIDPGFVGCSAGYDRDPGDTYFEALGGGSSVEMMDVEVMESWYPVRIEQRGPRPSTGGAGEFRAGSGLEMTFSVYGSDNLSMALLGNREQIPIAGLGGGLPGALTAFTLKRHDQAKEILGCHQQGIKLGEGDSIHFVLANGGGWGDPLDRAVSSVAADVRSHRLTPEQARQLYNVVVGDEQATERLRADMLAERLRCAEPAKRPLTWTAEIKAAAEGQCRPLYIGVEQRGSVAVSERTGAPLALSPDQWTDGCPVIHHFMPADAGVDVVAYLDPGSGHLLVVDVVVEGTERAFESSPLRWIKSSAGGATSDDVVSAL
ncbi:hydantoinase B/oxoprolinase family protein [Sphingobium sp.]|uniref:hydantoinase B/oxoprolinase family protein n=1 Tax=Sphingobium sp. TaxID=1912891 RepID=UPI002C6A46AA|nr:hydantoinase B/oxoprolinase family protein [Sphingobium sp.]HUD92948.1 hydantoinase B/oxoprolinase family protein [Sphingobium sp.]